MGHIETPSPASTNAADISSLRNVDELVLLSGNIIHSSRLKKNPNLTSREEVIETMICTIKTSLPHALQSTTTKTTHQPLIVHNRIHPERVDNRDELKISVKLFLFKPTVENLEDAMRSFTDYLQIEDVEALILAMPNFGSDFDAVRAVWKRAEQYVVDEETIVTLGVADVVSVPQLKSLYQWAQVKPSVNQVTLSGSCSVPADLDAYCKEHRIALNSHNDALVSDMYTFDMQCEMFDKAAEDFPDRSEWNSDAWRSPWLIRYWCVHRDRGIVRNKGYILRLSRKEQHRH